MDQFYNRRHLSVKLTFSSRLVELDKLRLATRKEESKELVGKGGVDPYVVVMPPSASKGGVSEKLIKVCEECREEFCSGTCIIFQYDSYQVKVHTVVHCVKYSSSNQV